MKSKLILFQILHVLTICKAFFSYPGFRISSRSEYSELYSREPPLKQIQIRYSCDDIDSDEISELLLEIGTLSVSVEVESMRPNVLNDEKNWSDLQRQKSWATALLRANFPKSYDDQELINIIKESFPDATLTFNTAEVEDKDWVSHVQSTWNPQVVGDLTIRFPWHNPADTKTPKELVLEGGAAFGTGNCHSSIFDCLNLLLETILS